MTIDQWAEFHQAKIEIDFSSDPAKVTIVGQGVTAESTSTLGAMDTWEEAYTTRMVLQGRTIQDMLEERKKTWG